MSGEYANSHSHTNQSQLCIKVVNASDLQSDNPGSIPGRSLVNQAVRTSRDGKLVATIANINIESSIN